MFFYMNLLKTYAIIAFTFYTHNHSSISEQQHDPFKSYKLSTFININKITDIEISNEWTSKKWHLSQIV